MRLAGPAIGGFLIAALGARAVYFVIAGLRLVSNAMLGRLPSELTGTLEEPPAGDEEGRGPRGSTDASRPVGRRRRHPEGPREHPLRELAGGFAYIGRDRTVGLLLAIALAFSMLSMPYFFLFPGFVSSVLDEGPQDLGLLISLTGVGSLAGAIVIASRPPRGRGRIFLLAGLWLGAAVLLFSMSSALWVTAPIMLALGLGDAGRMSLSSVLVQTSVEDAYRARVMSVYQMQRALASFYTFALGFAASFVGVQLALGASAVALIVLAATVFALAPRLRALDRATPRTSTRACVARRRRPCYAGPMQPPALGQPPALSLYLHIPFCTAKCGYCDFNSYEGLDHLVPDYTPALTRELALWGPAARNFLVATVFFGGGTPSLTSLADLERIVSTVREHYDVAPGAEWTLEANPTELTREHLAGMRALGINRLSMGVQSMHEDELALLERLHSPGRVVEAVADARAAGFENLNLDLIFGLIGQPLARWQETLERVIAFEPEHLSCYALTVEPGTALYYRVQKGLLPEPDPDVAADQYEWTRARLARAGYEQYEISNWARPGRRCAHNLVYWRADPYLGLGAGAHSFFAGRRFANVDAPNRYVEAVNRAHEERATNGRHTMHQIAGGETPDRATLVADAMILGLRLLDGVDLAAFAAQWECDPLAEFGGALERHEQLGLLERRDGRLRLTDRGLLLANEVAVDLLPDTAPEPAGAGD